MISQKFLKILSLPVTNAIIGVLFISSFFIASQNIKQTIRVADMAALTNLQPQPVNYFWELNINHAPFDRNKIRYYADYYEHLLEVFPSLWETYGLLGYCYHYLNNDPKAIKFLQIAIQRYPDYFWNYYNLAAIYINESRYQEAYDLLGEASNLNPMTSVKQMVTSHYVYSPLLGANEREVFIDSAKHLKEFYLVAISLEQIISHASSSAQAQAALSKLHLELYAF